jgi:heme-degrading monooxygenase HmoA
VTVLEHAHIGVRAGEEEDFEAAYRQARGILLATPGCRSVRMHRGIEHPSRFLLLVEWDTLENHTVDFRESDRFTHWRALIGPYFEGAPEVDHFQQIAD